MLELMDRAPGITAVLAYNDLMAIGALRAARRRGRSVPGDISVVGFDDVALAAYVDPPLTTLRQGTAEMGRWAVARLAERLRSRGALDEGGSNGRDGSAIPRARRSCFRCAWRSAARPVRRRAPERAPAALRRSATLDRAHLADLRRASPRGGSVRARVVPARPSDPARRPARGPPRRVTRPPRRSAGRCRGASGVGRRRRVAGPRTGGRPGRCHRRRSGRSRLAVRVGRYLSVSVGPSLSEVDQQAARRCPA